MATIANVTIVPKGRNWLLVDAEDYPKLKRHYVADGLCFWSTRRAFQNSDAGEQFIVADFSRSTAFPSSVVFQAGPVKNHRDEHPLAPVRLGLWPVDSSINVIGVATRKEQTDAIVASGQVPRGYYWVLVTASEKWPPSPAGAVSRFYEVQPSTGDAWRVLEVTQAVPIAKWPFTRWGPVTPGPDGKVDPYALGILAPEGSTMRERFIELGESFLETADEVKEGAKAAAKAGSGLFWGIGFAALGLALLRWKR